MVTPSKQQAARRNRDAGRIRNRGDLMQARLFNECTLKPAPNSPIPR